MKSTLVRVGLVIAFVVATMGGISTAPASAQQGACRKACNEAFRRARHDCRSVTPRPERRRCEERARRAHRECIRGCRPA